MKFKEKQFFYTNKWVIVFMLIFAILGWVKVINKGSITDIAIFCSIFLGIILITMLSSLETVIDEEKINYKLVLFPFSFSKDIYWDKVKKVEVVNFGMSALGFGLRYHPKYGKMLVVKGSFGMLIEQTNSKRMVIGTSKNHELNEAINGLVV